MEQSRLQKGKKCGKSGEVRGQDGPAGRMDRITATPSEIGKPKSNKMSLNNLALQTPVAADDYDGIDK